MDTPLNSLQNTALAHWMLEIRWAWATGEVLHYIGMSVLFGAVLLMDLRLLGLFRTYLSLRRVEALTPWALGAFVINMVTGIAFFITRPDSYLSNASYRVKLLCLLGAGINFAVFWLVIHPRIARLSEEAGTDLATKLVAASSLLLWTLVIIAGRMIPVYGLG